MIMYIFFVVMIKSSVLNQHTSMIYCLSKGYIQTFIQSGTGHYLSPGGGGGGTCYLGEQKGEKVIT